MERWEKYLLEIYLVYFGQRVALWLEKLPIQNPSSKQKGCDNLPKTERASLEERELAELIRSNFAGAYVLTLQQIGQVIGVKSPNTTRLWVSTLVPRKRNGRNVWLVSDVAQKICRSVDVS